MNSSLCVTKHEIVIKNVKNFLRHRFEFQKHKNLNSKEIYVQIFYFIHVDRNKEFWPKMAINWHRERVVQRLIADSIDFTCRKHGLNYYNIFVHSETMRHRIQTSDKENVNLLCCKSLLPDAWKYIYIGRFVVCSVTSSIPCAPSSLFLLVFSYSLHMMFKLFFAL